jgi:hypothetical protein
MDVKLHTLLTWPLYDGKTGQLLVMTALPPRNNPQYPFNRKPDGPQSHSGHFGEEEISISCWESNSNSLGI